MPPTPAIATRATESEARQPERARFRGPVLVASDGTDQSLPALEMARLLGEHGATVDVVSVIEPLVLPPPEVPVNWAEVDTARRGELTQRVVQQAHEALGTGGAAHVETMLGLAVPEISGLARARRASLVVTGLRHYGGFERVFLRGETPLRIARAARTPVLVVPGRVEHLPRVVVLATDLDDASINAARIARPLLAEAREIHVINVRPFETLPGGDATTSWAQLYSRLTTDSFDKVIAALDCAPDVKIESRTLTGHPVDEILEYAEHVGAELIVSGYHKRVLLDRVTGPRSVAERVYRGTRCPMLLVPESAVVGSGTDALAQSEVFTEPDQWTVALSAFTVRNAGRAAKLEIDTRDAGGQAEVAGFPLRSVDYEHDTQMLHVTFGASDGGVPRLGHAIERPRSVELQRGPDGRDLAMRVSHEGGYTLLTFFDDAYPDTKRR